MKALGLPFTLLGVDLVADGMLIFLDADEKWFIKFYFSKWGCRLIPNFNP